MAIKAILIIVFQEFVEDVLNIKGKWTVPRGGCKQIKTSNITVRLYENGSVLLEGPMFEEYIEDFRTNSNDFFGWRAQ